MLLKSSKKYSQIPNVPCRTLSCEPEHTNGNVVIVTVVDYSIVLDSAGLTSVKLCGWRAGDVLHQRPEGGDGDTRMLVLNGEDGPIGDAGAGDLQQLHGEDCVSTQWDQCHVWSASHIGEHNVWEDNGSAVFEKTIMVAQYGEDPNKHGGRLASCWKDQ